MRSYQPPADTRFYAGVDLHARSLYLVILDRDGLTRFGRNLPAAPEPFLRAVQPFRDGLLVACECVHPWYWLADTCRDHAIAFVLGHAWAMKAIHGCKTKCDRKDAEAIARLLKGGNFPPAYAYPKERRRLRARRPPAPCPQRPRASPPRPPPPPPGRPRRGPRAPSRRVRGAPRSPPISPTPSSAAASKPTWPCWSRWIPLAAASRPRSKRPPR